MALLAWYTSEAQASAASVGVITLSTRPNDVFDDQFRRVSHRLDPWDFDAHLSFFRTLSVGLLFNNTLETSSYISSGA